MYYKSFFTPDGRKWPEHHPVFEVTQPITVKIVRRAQKVPKKWFILVCNEPEMGD